MLRHLLLGFCIILGSVSVCSAQSSGVICYKVGTTERVPCNSAPRPPSRQQPSQPTEPDTSAADAARRAEEERIAREKREREEAENAARLERERIAREKQERFEREKEDANRRLKGGSRSSDQLKGTGLSRDLLKGGSGSGSMDLKHPVTIVAGVRGSDLAADSDGLPFDLDGLGRLAEKLGWSDEELKRFLSAALALNDFDPGPKDERQAMWAKIKARDTVALRRAAAAEKGAGMPSAGFQTGTYGDCVIFAISNAAGLPYGVAATRAIELLESEEWRLSYERADPQSEVIKRVPGERRGMTGNEMLFLAEAFGQAEVVRPKNFAAVLAAGRPVLVNIGSGHQVLLSKAFQYRGETWFEMVDSQAQGPWQRRYMKPQELDVILLENGVAYRSEPGRTVKSLK